MNNRPEIRDEEILLIGLSRLSFGDELKSSISELISSVNDFDYFVRLAGEHGVAALIYHNLSVLGLIDRLPEQHAGMLRSAYHLNISRNAFHLTALEELLTLLGGESIKVVLLKGLALELMVYGNAGLRQMTDVDILIDRRDYIRARNILMQNGYDTLPVKSGFHKPIVEWTGKHLPSLMKVGVSVDIHLELFPGKKNDLTKKTLETASEISVERERAFVPVPRLLFLYLVRHLHGHELNNESQLRLYADLVVLVENYREEIFSYDLIEEARAAGIRKITASKLQILRDLWGIELPGMLNEFTKKWFDPASVNKFVFFLKSPKGNKPVARGKAYRKMLGEIPGIHRKLLFLLGDIFPSVSFMKKRYGTTSTFRAILFYPLRLGKLFRLLGR